MVKDDDGYAVDAEFYDAIHDGSDDDTGLWLSFAGQTDAGVLVVGCGSGRIAVPLALAGHRVTGLDVSPAMLERARLRAKREGAEVTLIEGNVLSAPIKADSYGLTLIPAGVFLYCKDASEQIGWLRSLARCMAFNGRLIVDLPGPASWLDPSLDGQPLLAFRGATEDGAGFEAWHVHEDDLASQTRWLQVTYERVDGDGIVRRWRSEHTLRYVYPAELEHLLSIAGLRPVAMYGDYDAGALSNESGRMIAVAERSNG
jgi:SAM-dependent methyltransferase